MKNLPFAIAVAAALAGCAASSPAPVLLTLPPARMPAPAAAGPSAPLLAVRRVVIPEYLVSRRVRYRADAATLAEWPNTYWAERIEIGVAREFVAELRLRLPDWQLCDGSCGDRQPALVLQVEIVPMEFVRTERLLNAQARVVVSGANALPLRSEAFGYSLTAGADTAQAQAQVIAELVRRVAHDAAPLVAVALPSSPADAGR